LLGSGRNGPAGTGKNRASQSGYDAGEAWRVEIIPMDLKIPLRDIPKQTRS
jgi:hypothetical protein